MAIYLTRNPLQGAASNTAAPNGSEFRWYEKTYAVAGTQEWIFIPDIDGVSVTLTPSTSTASLDLTDSPPDVINNGSPNTVKWSLGDVTAATTGFLQGFTAFRVNITVGTTAKISARA